MPTNPIAARFAACPASESASRPACRAADERRAEPTFIRDRARDGTMRPAQISESMQDVPIEGQRTEACGYDRRAALRPALFVVLVRGVLTGGKPGKCNQVSFVADATPLSPGESSHIQHRVIHPGINLAWLGDTHRARNFPGDLTGSGRRRGDQVMLSRS